jgi:hypothetical protein
MARVSISGLEQLKAELRKFPDAIQARAVQTGVRKAAGKLRTALRRAAYAKVAKGYKRKNRLRQAIRSAVGKRPQYKGKAWVGLKAVPGERQTRHYYKVLEAGRKAYRRRSNGAQYAASPAMKPFWQKTVRANSSATLRILIDETLKAIAYEAGKAFGRSKGRR